MNYGMAPATVSQAVWQNEAKQKRSATAPHAVLAREVREWMAFWQNEPKLHRWPWRQSDKPFWQSEAKTHNRSTATQAGFGETNPTRSDGDADERAQ